MAKVTVNDSRFIPARAGNANNGVEILKRKTVHPRASGERSHVAGGRATIGGSSPRERGTRHKEEPPE